jgi:hypothetical protein
MKNMDEATYILKINIERDRSKKVLALSQKYYIRKVLKKFHIQDCKSIDTPMAKDKSLNLRMWPKTPDQKAQIKNVSYSSVIGSLIYAMICTRPDISFIVGMISRYQANPGQSHWKTVK